MTINYDDFLLMHYDMNAYRFEGVENIEAAMQYMYDHTTQDFLHTAVYTPNENGEGVRADQQTIWIIYTNEELPSEFFTKLTLSEEGEARKQAIIDEKLAMQAATEEFLRNNPLPQ